MAQPTRYRIRAHGISDKGLTRSVNDDSLMVEDAFCCYAVADGLGGLPEGALASRLAVEEVKRAISLTNGSDQPDFPAIFAEANERVQTEGQRINQDLGIGTTLTVAHFSDEQMHIGHIGDSGLVVFTPNTWVQITKDHTMAQDMLDRLNPGEHAFIPEYFNHTLTRCIGQNSPISTDTYDYKLEGTERVLLFSDGVTKTISMQELHEMVFNNSEPEQLVRKIIDLANERGGPDNVTAVAVFLDPS